MVVAGIPVCIVCGSELRTAWMHACGDVDSPYCRCCTHDDGTPLCRAELLDRLVDEAMTEDGLDWFEASAWAEAEVREMHLTPA